jgi:potassium-transporting ATPase KdpC subunit
MKTQTIIALKFLVVMTFLTGVIYPFFMTGVAQLSFPSKANGSMVWKNGKIIGSELIGQNFDSSIYFWSRPSAVGYNPIPSGATNYGPTSDTLRKQVAARRISFAAKNSMTDVNAIPKEMIFASGSGLDPHISPEAAMLQVSRVATARKFDETKKQEVQQLIKNLTEEAQFSLLGEPRINVFKLNLALDNLR